MLNVEVLNIFLSGRQIGKLSASMRAVEPGQHAALWKDITAAAFNGADGRLPSFFQNMLPEGMFRLQLAQERGCKEDDHFALFAACGLDLPGAVKAMPATLAREALACLVTQENDALEMSVTAEPLPLQRASMSARAHWYRWTEAPIFWP